MNSLVLVGSMCTITYAYFLTYIRRYVHRPIYIHVCVHRYICAFVRTGYWRRKVASPTVPNNVSEVVELVWNLMAHGDAREGKWTGNWRMEWVASTHTTSERGVSTITNADAHTSAANSRLNWLPRRFKWTRPFRRKIKSGFCACAIRFQTNYTNSLSPLFASIPLQ